MHEVADDVDIDESSECKFQAGDLVEFDVSKTILPLPIVNSLTALIVCVKETGLRKSFEVTMMTDAGQLLRLSDQMLRNMAAIATVMRVDP